MSSTPIPDHQQAIFEKEILPLRTKEQLQTRDCIFQLHSLHFKWDKALYLHDAYVVRLTVSSAQPSPAQPHLNYTSSAHPTSCIGGKDASSSFLLQSPMRHTRGWNVDCGSRMCSSKAAGALFYIFPSVSSANIASGCFLPARNKRSWVACTLFWSRLRSHQLTQRQKGWQPVRIPGASLLHPVSVCWTKRWHKALADSAHQFSTLFLPFREKTDLLTLVPFKRNM